MSIQSQARRDFLAAAQEAGEVVTYHRSGSADRSFKALVRRPAPGSAPGPNTVAPLQLVRIVIPVSDVETEGIADPRAGDHVTFAHARFGGADVRCRVVSIIERGVAYTAVQVSP